MQRLLCVIGSFRLTRNGLLRQTANRTANIPSATIRENLDLPIHFGGTYKPMNIFIGWVLFCHLVNQNAINPL